MACATLKRNLDWESVSQLPTKRRRCSPYAPSTSPGLKMSENRPSPFGESVPSTSKMTPERMAQEICDEIKRLHRRRRLRLALGAAEAPGAAPASSSSGSGSEGEGGEAGACQQPPRPPRSAHPRPHHRALFTFKQVRMICERMLREQEVALRTEYEAALSGKLAEQYEAFVRFNLDQVQRHQIPAHHMQNVAGMHQEPPSYLS